MPIPFNQRKFNGNSTVLLCRIICQIFQYNGMYNKKDFVLDYLNLKSQLKLLTNHSVTYQLNKEMPSYNVKFS